MLQLGSLLHFAFLCCLCGGQYSCCVGQAALGAVMDELCVMQEAKEAVKDAAGDVKDNVKGEADRQLTCAHKEHVPG